MTFETMDWKAEAARVGRAFGVEGEVGFYQYSNPHSTRFELEWERDVPIWAKGLRIAVIYSPTERAFSVADSFGRKSEIALNWDDSLAPRLFKRCEPVVSTPLARALFRLGLLSPEVEAELGVSVSEQERLEWGLEYKAVVSEKTARQVWKEFFVWLWETIRGIEPAKKDPSIYHWKKGPYFYTEGERTMEIWANYDTWYVDADGEDGPPVMVTIHVHSIRRWRAPHDRERVSEAEQQRILESFCRLLAEEDTAWELSLYDGEYHPDEDLFYERDWEEEADKIMLAFGIKKPWEFVASDEVRTMNFIRLPDGQKLSTQYKIESRSFQLYKKHESVTPIAAVQFDWAGQPLGKAEINEPADALAQGLYNLGLLGPELEAAFGVTAHQKMEWTLEYEAS